MLQVLKTLILSFFISTTFIMLILPEKSARADGMQLGIHDLKLYYGDINSLELFATPYKGFTYLTGKPGWWEDEDKYQYTWKDGQAAFIITGEMKSPQLVQVVLNNSFSTPREVKKGSTIDEVIKAYPGNYKTTQVTDGTWYVYKWTVGNISTLAKEKSFSLSFYIENGLVNSVMLKLESPETEDIPVG